MSNTAFKAISELLHVQYITIIIKRKKGKINIIFWTFSIVYIWTAPLENVFSSICWQRWPRSACTSSQSDQGLCSPPTELFYTINCINVKQMSGWYFAHARHGSISTHFEHARRHFLACCGPFDPFDVLDNMCDQWRLASVYVSAYSYQNTRRAFCEP